MERKIALEILNEISGKGAYSNLALGRKLRESRVDEAFVRRLVYGVLEKRLYLDYVLRFFIRTPLEKMRFSTLNLLRLGVYQIMFMDSVPAYAAVDETVRLSKTAARGQSSFVNGVLRNVMRKAGEIPLPDPEKDFLEWLSVSCSYPKWLLGYWAKAYGKAFARKLAEAGNETPPFTIRVNRLKTDRERLAEQLAEDGFETEKAKNSSQALFVMGKAQMSSSLLETKAFQKGYFQIQDESSMLAVECLDPRPGETVADLCAAPGGKTVYMAERMENKGEILAFDLYPHKLELIQKNAYRHGVSCIRTQAADASVFQKDLEGLADRVLCDVPCSGLGVIRRKPEIKYQKRYEDILALAKIQKSILQCAAAYVKPGGYLLYSTCTVSPLENEEMVRSFLNENRDFICEEETLLTPFEQGTDGFFFCKFKKNE